MNCSLKSGKDPESSSTDVLMQQVIDELAKHGANGEIVRAVDSQHQAGRQSDEGKGDDGRRCASGCWPPISW